MKKQNSIKGGEFAFHMPRTKIENQPHEAEVVSIGKKYNQ